MTYGIITNRIFDKFAPETTEFWQPQCFKAFFNQKPFGQQNDRQGYDFRQFRYRAQSDVLLGEKRG